MRSNSEIERSSDRRREERGGEGTILLQLFFQWRCGKNAQTVCGGGWEAIILKTKPKASAILVLRTVHLNMAT